MAQPSSDRVYRRVAGFQPESIPILPLKGGGRPLQRVDGAAREVVFTRLISYITKPREERQMSQLLTTGATGMFSSFLFSNLSPQVQVENVKGHGVTRREVRMSLFPIVGPDDFTKVSESERLRASEKLREELGSSFPIWFNEKMYASRSAKNMVDGWLDDKEIGPLLENLFRKTDGHAFLEDAKYATDFREALDKISEEEEDATTYLLIFSDLPFRFSMILNEANTLLKTQSNATINMLSHTAASFKERRNLRLAERRFSLYKDRYKELVKTCDAISLATLKLKLYVALMNSSCMDELLEGPILKSEGVDPRVLDRYMGEVENAMAAAMVEIKEQGLKVELREIVFESTKKFASGLHELIVPAA
ncbi:MAG: hypothetical protein JRM80_00760 [Nitrososphaerota archaeon]|nr:hypothetical protein [Nitrososphaerota archaeon]